MGVYESGVYKLNYTGDEIDERLSRATPEGTVGRNLLDNWYFVGGHTAGVNKLPINQRNEWSYRNVAYSGYFIDRWYLYGSGWFDPTYNLVVKPYNNITVAQFFQKLDSDLQDFLDGKTVTATAIYGDGSSVLTGTVVYHKATQIEIATNPGLYSLSFGTDGNFYVFAYDQIGLKAIKLELGSIQTLARKVGNAWVLNDPPPNYQQELAKCSAYLHIIKAADARNLMIGIGNANASNSVYWDMTIPIMVTTPSLSVVANKIGIGESSFTLNAATVSLFNYSAGHAAVQAAGFSGLTPGQPYRIALMSGGTMIFSAE